MSRLEDLQSNAAVKGILPDAPDALVTVVTTQWFGSEAVEPTYKTAGKVANEPLCRHDEPRFEVVEEGRPWSLDGDRALFRLVFEAHRIRLAHLFDDFILDIVQFHDDDRHTVHFVRRPFQREPGFGVTSVNCDFGDLLARAEAPR